MTVSLAQPMPIPGPLTREQVARMPLAAITLNNAAGSGEHAVYSIPLLTPSSATDSPHARIDRNARPDKVVPFAGSFTDAVKAANQLVLSSSGGRYAPALTGVHAHAVVDAGDGQWFLTALGDKSADLITWIDPGVTSSRVTSVRPLHPSVKAVVGAATFHDFSKP